MKLEIRDKSRRVSEIMSETGFPLDMRCGGRGTCGRCRIQLLAGHWNVNGEMVSSPAASLACQTRLLSEEGIIEFEESALMPSDNGVVSEDWRTERVFPVKDEVIVGIDVGTTTLAACALYRGRIIGRVSRYNPQSQFGDNVISRISASREHLADMQHVLIKALHEMLHELPEASRIGVAGNSTMMCLFHGIDPTPLGAVPFTVPQRQFPAMPGTLLGLSPSVEIVTVPLLTAYLGGDILGGICEAGLEPGDFFVDIGTNCEMVYRLSNGRYVGTAAAAGPAFEGAGVSCGLRAVPGAISRYRSQDDFDVIGQGRPQGVCGSGMIDILAAEHAHHHLNRFGRIQPTGQSLQVAPGVSVTEGDIEQLLKAKAAVYSGIQTLEEHFGERCRRLLLAGGFAQYINLESAFGIGLLPRRECKILGNTSLASAVRLAASPEYLDELVRYQDSIPEIPLNTISEFEDNFIDGMLLP